MEDGPPRVRPAWLVAVAVVAAGQLGLALHLFGPHPRAALADDRPLVGGRHPLHLYHGAIGAANLRDRGAATGYDPQFQAGYPKTPVFDPGSRPAELFLLAAGGGVSPPAYKRGLVGVCLLVPLAFAVGGWAAGLGGRGLVLAAAAGTLLFWTPPARHLLDAGHLDLHLAGLAAVVGLGGLVRYADRPGPAGWVVLAGASAVGWFAHPLAWLGLVPALAAYYVYRAPRHGPGWHLGLLAAGAAGLLPNLRWLLDWGRFWWLRQSLADDYTPLPGRACLLGCPADYLPLLGGPVGVAAAVLGACGILCGLRAGRRTLPGVTLAAAGSVLLAGRLGATWPPLRAAADGVGAFAAAVLVLPAANLVAGWWGRTPAGGAATAGVAAGVLLLGWAGGPAAAGLGLDLRPLPLGLSRDRLQLADGITRHTGPDARILFEEPDTSRPGWNWTALLPALTGRAFVGGLDPDGGVEHLQLGLRADALNGRRFADWTADDRRAFARRYNLGWVACRSPAAVAFWAADPTARVVDRFRDGPGEVVLFVLDRPRSFVLAGSARVERADRRRLVLADVVPANGEVVLSFHHHPGMRAAPDGTAGVGTAPDPFDPIPLLRLTLAGPAARVTVAWDRP